MNAQELKLYFRGEIYSRLPNQVIIRSKPYTKLQLYFASDAFSAAQDAFETACNSHWVEVLLLHYNPETWEYGLIDRQERTNDKA